VSPVYVVQFATEADYPSVQFVIDFDKFNPIEEGSDGFADDVVRKELAHAMSVIPERVSVISINKFKRERRRRLQIGNADAQELVNTDVYTQNAIVVYLANDKFSDMMSPNDIVDALTVDEVNRWLSRHTTLMATVIGAAAVLTNEPPAWEVEGNLWDASESSLTVSGKLKRAGYIHAVFLDTEAEEPTPQQVVWGLDANNQPTRHASAYYDGTSESVYATYKGLEQGKVYQVFVSAENDYPGNNKAVIGRVSAYSSVQTDAGEDCNPCDDPYMLADDYAVLMSVARLLLALFLV
jgi:hypothetical protein